MSFGGILAFTVTQGVPDEDPGIKQFLWIFTFPVALSLIFFFGAELFTGNCMTMPLGMLHRKVTWKGLATNWFVSYFGNWAGCVFGAYFFGYLSGQFANPPWLANVQAVVEKKCSFQFHVAFFRALGANWLVCLAFFVQSMAEDLGGKIVATFLIIGCFAASSYEHSVANMYYIDQGLMYGANTTFGTCVANNFVPVTLGNILAGLVMAFGLWHVHGTKQNVNRPGPELLTVSCLL